jgi:hypothetical protein
MRVLRRIELLLFLGIVLASVAAACGGGKGSPGAFSLQSSSHDAGTSSTDGGGGGSGSDATVGFGGDGPTLMGADVVSALAIAPTNSTIMVAYGQQTPTVTFTATMNGASVPAAFTMGSPQIGGLSGAGVMTPTGLFGGTATVTASYGGQMATTTVTVVITMVDNGVPAGEDAGVGGSGGNGGVGGAGPGGPVDMPTQMALEGPTMPDPSLAWLYPYDKTVWPQGVLPPLLQWATSQSYTAIYIQLEEKAFQYQGFFSAPATPFVNHPVLPTAWNTLLSSNQGANDPVTVTLTFALNGQAYGPLTETWIVSTASLTGTVYYNSYGTSLVQNFCCAMDGSQFGGATLAITQGATSPVVVAGTSSGSAASPDQTGCRVCHSVAALGSTLVTQHGDNYAVSSAYGLTMGNAETVMTPQDYRFAFPAMSPDGTYLFTNAASLPGIAPTQPSGLYSVPTGTAISSTGIPNGLLAGTPAFSPDGTHVAFNYYGGGNGGADQASLAAMDFAQPTSTFSNFRVLHTPPAGSADVFPAFFPTSSGLVFEVETGTEFGATRDGMLGQIWWLDLATMTPTLLSTLNGVGYLPTGPNNHSNDSVLNYEPTVNPVATGGYAWVVFTSRRLYGNVATIDPFLSDPRNYPYKTEATTKKLWVAAIDLNAAPGTDPSHPAFYLPGQELFACNSRGYWVVDPCEPDGAACNVGSQCCNGYCNPDEGGFVCGSSTTTGGCSMLGNHCTMASDCCGASQGIECIDGFCSQPAPQ